MLLPVASWSNWEMSFLSLLSLPVSAGTLCRQRHWFGLPRTLRRAARVDFPVERGVVRLEEAGDGVRHVRRSSRASGVELFLSQ